jgi:hypothetical protein
MKDFKTFVTSGYKNMVIKERIAESIIDTFRKNKNKPMRASELADTISIKWFDRDLQFTTQKVSAILRQMYWTGLIDRNEVDTGKTFECKYFDNKTQTIKTCEKPIIHAYFSLK